MWKYGKMNRRFSIVFFTLFSSGLSFYILTLISSFYGLCLQSMSLPCDGANCPVQPSCPPNIVETISHYASIVIPLFIILIGVVLFVRAGKSPKGKNKQEK